MKPGMLAGIVLLVGALFLLVGGLTQSWETVSFEDFHGHSGLLRFSSCGAHDCDGEWLLKALGHSGPTKFKFEAVMGLFTTLAAVGSAVLGGIFGIFALTGKPKRGLAIVAMILVGCAGAAALAFMLMLDKPKEVSWGYSMFLFWLGFLAALTGSILGMLTKGAAQMAQMPMMPMPMPPPCSTCGRPTQLVPQYQRFFCATCNRYL